MGRKAKYNEETKNVTFKCPTSKETEFRKEVAPILKKWEIGSVPEKTCDCKIEGKLFRRALGCKLPKDKHNFN